MSRWNHLSTEIVINIFDCFINSNPHSVCNYALVCKYWGHPAQLKLYSKVEITKKETLDLFLRTMIDCHSLSQMLKLLKLGEFCELAVKHSIAIERLFKHLPNLEDLEFPKDEPVYFLTLLSSLLDSQLPRIKRIPNPGVEEETFGDFTTCTLLLKDRFEGCGHDPTEKTLVGINRLYSKLDRFENLNSIQCDLISKDKFEVMEYVTKHCTSLDTASFYLMPLDYESNICIEKCTPRPNIKHLRNEGRVNDFSIYVSYLIHKFPRLDSIYIEVEFENEETRNEDMNRFVI